MECCYVIRASKKHTHHGDLSLIHPVLLPDYYVLLNPFDPDNTVIRR